VSDWCIERAEDLADRLVSAGPKCCAVSASECHEITDFIGAAIQRIDELETDERQLSGTIRVLLSDYRGLEQQLNEYKAHCERLKVCAQNFYTFLCLRETMNQVRDLIESTPSTSLALHDAEVIDEVSDHLMKLALEHGLDQIRPSHRRVMRNLKEYAANLRKQAEGGE